MMKCPFCGYDFSIHEAEGKCRGCPLNKSCHVICCPNCNYKFVEESEIVKFIKKRLSNRGFLKKKRKK